MKEFLKKECDLKYFHDNGYYRKKCKSCGSHFWTLDEEAELCGDRPCVEFSFIGNPLGKKNLSISEVRESFLSFFEKNGHSRLSYPVTGERCPVIARWRTDIYLTIASIADFQPHVTSGKVPPPANPLVISQPCIRLNDLEQVGVSGRHLTTFEMMGHHAFNKNKENEIYFKEKTVELCDQYFNDEIGIPRKAIKYKEQLWSGGGNAGPCLEVLAGGLEIATLVFMNMKEDKNGEYKIKGKRYSPNPLKIVDTGYGLERIAWLTQGTQTVYDTLFPELIKKMIDFSEKKEENIDEKSLYSLADHTKCIAFMLGDGIVPSNNKAGYLARLIIRRSLRFLEELKINEGLGELVEIQLDFLKKDFPSLNEKRNQIIEILEIETKKFKDTLSKGKNLVKRLLKEKENIEKDELIELYDTHGMPPEIVKKIAARENVEVNIPDNFDSMIAEMHSYEKKEEKNKVENKETPKTYPLYYNDHYMKEFEAKVIWKNKTKEGTEIVLDKTAFYPEGGGQPGDKGFIYNNGNKYPVKKVRKNDESIIHLIEGDIKENEKIHGKIDWNYRYTLMKHHTGTHVINGALRKILGEHVWQAGSQLGINEARFDFTHYKKLTSKKVKEIEKLANHYINQGQKVEKKVMDRNSAEKKYGFRIYQGGVPPGNSIRILNIQNIDVEACGGTHLQNIDEIEKIRILKSERIQDGVNRVVFAAGKKADEFMAEEKELFNSLLKEMSGFYKVKEKENISDQIKKASEVFSVQKNQLLRSVKRFIEETGKPSSSIKVKNLKQASENLFERWKKTQKEKEKVSSNEIESLEEKAEKIKGTDIKIIIGKSESKGTNVAGRLIQKNKFVVHIYDGNKIVSAASEDIDIDLRDIAKEIGRILGGGGGGKPKMTQSGGPKVEKINEAFETAKKLTKEKLQK
ncbi:MAG: alanine--tRNA ligase [Candidatus Thermoplasmatota archaeon]